VALQRGQLEDLIQSLSRSRDENLLVDIEAGLRMAQQQAQLTGSTEPFWPPSNRRSSACSAPRSRAWRRCSGRSRKTSSACAACKPPICRVC